MKRVFAEARHCDAKSLSELSRNEEHFIHGLLVTQELRRREKDPHSPPQDWSRPPNPADPNTAGPGLEARPSIVARAVNRDDTRSSSVQCCFQACFRYEEREYEK